MIKNLNKKLLYISMIFMGLAVSTSAQEGVVTVDMDKDIAKLLEYKKDLKTVDFYKIQIFSNSNRSDAESARSSFRRSFGQYTTDLVYDTPNFKVQVGNFRTKLEADKALQNIKRKYSGAFIFKSKKD